MSNFWGSLHYLKTIFVLNSQTGVRGSEIAKSMKVSRPTVSVALKALEQEGYVRMDGHHLFYLTERGLKIARETYERNRFFQELLMALGVERETAERDACELEHSVSPESFLAIREALDGRRG